MKKLIYLSMVLLATGCAKDFIEKKPYDAIATADAVNSEANIQVALRGVYQGLRNVDLYGRTAPVLGDLYGDNSYVSVTNSNRYIAFYTYLVSVADGNVTGLWTAAYNNILRANNIINSTVAANTNVNQYKGEAYAIRALMYFELVRFFAKPYKDNPTAAGVPVITVYDINLKPARKTVAEVYTQIISDLNLAITNMTLTTTSNQFNKVAAKALLAKVYLTQGDLPNAKTTALDVINTGGYTSLTTANYASYWANTAPRTDKLETLFEVGSDAVGNLAFDALTNIYNQAGYGDLMCSSDLAALYTATDVRATLLQAGTRGGLPSIFVKKYSNLSTDRDDTKVLRMSDIYLIAAEASLPANETDAKTYLNYVASRRDPSYVNSTATGAALQDAIIQERRKELAFEGDRYHDLNRLKLDVNRSTNYLPATNRILTFANTKRLMPIPQVELDANKAMVQNPGY
jgi:starch-binding outer membrane protein, SusD/RagB family